MSLNFGIIGRKIKEIRQSHGLTQEKLAELCNLSASYISHIESGKKKAGLKSLEKLGDILGIPIATLLNGNQNDNFSEYKSKLLWLIEDCSCSEKQIIYDVATATKKSLRNNN